MALPERLAASWLLLVDTRPILTVIGAVRSDCAVRYARLRLLCIRCRTQGQTHGGDRNHRYRWRRRCIDADQTRQRYD